MDRNWVIKYAIRAIDNFSPSADAVARSSKSAEKAIKSFDKRLNKLKQTKKDVNFGDIAGAMIGGAALKGAFTQFATFEKLMSDVSTLIDTNTEDMGKMTKQIKNMALVTGQPIEQLATGLYDVRSAGISAGDAMGFLQKSAQLALAGKGTTQQAVKMMASAKNAFGLTGQELEKLSDVIFKTVDAGITDIAQLSQGFGGVAPIVANAGVKIDELMASVGALTAQGVPASEVYTQLKAVISGFTRQNTTAMKAFRKYGAKNFKEFVQKSGGLIQALENAKVALKGNDKAMLDMLGSTEALSAMQALTGKANMKYKDTLDAMRLGSNEVNKAFKKQMKTAYAMSQTLSNANKILMIQLGRYLVPLVSALTVALKGLADGFAFASEKAPMLTNILVYGALALIGLKVAVVAFVFVAGQLAGAFSMLVTGALAFKTALHVLAVAMSLNPVGAIITALKVLVGIFITAYSTSEKFRDRVNGALTSVYNKFKQVISFIAEKSKYLNPANWFGDGLDKNAMQANFEGYQKMQQQGITPQQMTNKNFLEIRGQFGLDKGLTGTLDYTNNGKSLVSGNNSMSVMGG